jgi:hypothetical protein
MSTTTVSVRSTTRDIEIEELRSREAEVREAIRRRIGVANKTIAMQENCFQSAVARLDAAARRLPDLALSALTLPALNSDIANNPAMLETYATQLTAEVVQFERRLGAAIAEAERLFARRIAKATAWRNAADLEQQLDLRTQASLEVAMRLNESVTFASSPEKLQSEAELEAVEAYVTALRQQLEHANRLFSSLHARSEARTRATALAGTMVSAQSADVAHARYEENQIATAQAVLRGHLDSVLSNFGLRINDLCEGARALIDDALAYAHCQDQRERITRWIAREQQHREGVARALTLMQSVPNLVHEDRALALRWASLLVKLQRVAGGLDDFTPSVEREYEQIRADARRLLNMTYTKADLVQALNEHGFEIFEREDGHGLIVVDLDHPETWFEATELESEQGGFAVVLELKTDVALADEAKVTADICAKLARTTSTTTPNVKIQAEIIEHENRIKRARRPAKAHKTFAQGI